MGLWIWICDDVKDVLALASKLQLPFPATHLRGQRLIQSYKTSVHSREMTHESSQAWALAPLPRSAFIHRARTVSLLLC